MHNTWQRTRSFLSITIQQHILQKRLLIIVPVLLLEAYIGGDQMLVAAKNQG
jgi:hypothetical protein